MKIAVAMRHAMSHVLKQRKRQSVSATSAILRDPTDSIMRNGKSAKFLKEYNTNFTNLHEYGKEGQRTNRGDAADDGGLLAEPVGRAGGAEGLSVPVNREAA